MRAAWTRARCPASLVCTTIVLRQTTFRPNVVIIERTAARIGSRDAKVMLTLLLLIRLPRQLVEALNRPENSPRKPARCRFPRHEWARPWTPGIRDRADRQSHG